MAATASWRPWRHYRREWQRKRRRRPNTDEGGFRIYGGVGGGGAASGSGRRAEGQRPAERRREGQAGGAQRAEWLEVWQKHRRPRVPARAVPLPAHTSPEEQKTRGLKHKRSGGSQKKKEKETHQTLPDRNARIRRCTRRLFFPQISGACALAKSVFLAERSVVGSLDGCTMVCIVNRSMEGLRKLGLSNSWAVETSSAGPLSWRVVSLPAQV